MNSEKKKALHTDAIDVYLSLLYDRADDWEAETLDNLRIRAGLVNECVNCNCLTLEDEKCANCGKSVNTLEE